MARWPKNTGIDDDMPSAELVSVRPSPSVGQIVVAEDDEMIPTRQDLAYGYAGAYLPTQNGGYLGQVLTQDQISYLMGPQPLPTPRPLIKLYNFFSHIAQSPIAPGIGVLAMAGLSVWAHGETDHQWIGGGIIAVGALLIRSAVHAHKKHGADADEMFTKGAALAGLGTAILGVGVTAGMSRWEGLAVGAGTVLAYGLRAALKSRNLERSRGFAVALVASGNTGPTVPYLPPHNPWNGPVSDEEMRLTRALGAVAGDGAMIGPVRRINPDAWYVIVNLTETKTNPEKLAKAAADLAARTGARRVEVLPGPNPASSVKLIVHDGDDPLDQTVEGPGPTITSVLQPLPIGRFEDLSEIEYLLAWNHLLIAGATDNGKSGVMDAIIVGTLACEDVVRIGIDCKAGAPSFGVYRPVMMHVAETPEDGMRVLAGLEAVYEYRGRLLGEKSVPSEENEEGIPVRKWRTEFGPFILAFLDELYELTSEVKGAAKRIQRLNALSRYVGIVKADATQTPSRNVFDKNTDARLNYQGRIGLRVVETNAIQMIMGQGSVGRGWALNLLNGQGKLMIQSRQHDRPRVGRGYFYSDERIARFVAQYAEFAQSVKLDEGSEQAFWEGYHAATEEEIEDGGGGGPRGGKHTEQQDAPVAYGRPHLVVVPTYPNGEEIAEEDVALWQLLGEYGRDGSSANPVAARAKALGHRYNSPPWVLGRFRFWAEKGFVDKRKEGREEIFWRKDLRSEVIRDGAAS